MPTLNGFAYPTIAEAMVNITDNMHDQTIILTADHAEDVVIPANRDVTIDLAGFTLTNAGEAHTITVEGALRVKGPGTVLSTAAGRAAVFVTPTGEAVIDGNPSMTQSKGDYYVMENQGRLAILLGDFVSTSPNASLLRNGYENETMNLVGNTAITEVSGGTFKGQAILLKNDTAGDLQVSGGTFVTDKECVLNWNVCEISGGNFQSNALECVWTAANTPAEGYVSETIGVTRIRGGTFKGVGADLKLIADYAPANAPPEYAVSGGTFSAPVDDAFCVNGFKVVQMEDGTFAPEVVRDWDLPEGGILNLNLWGYKRLLIRRDSMDYASGGFDLPVEGFEPAVVIGVNVKGGADAYWNSATRKIQLFRNNKEISGKLEDLTLMVIGR